uniref:S100/CaBP-9k-type calcium binding subdomain domain-containing protein n=1 Tax=Suricata suricatta TaxID=37032 RepID=A0A673UCF9_SURSU
MQTWQKGPAETETEQCIESPTAIFQKYAGKEGNNGMLSESEFLTFINTELSAFTKNQKDPTILDCMMKKLDLNFDRQLDFQKCLNLIGSMAKACYDSFTKSTHYGSESEWLLGLASRPFSFLPTPPLLLTSDTYPEPRASTAPCSPILLVG